MLPVKLHSAINAVVPSSQDSLLKIKRYTKRRVNKNNCCCLHVCSLDSNLCCNHLTNDELISCNSKLDMFSIQFDHSTSVAAITVIFTRLIVGEDEHVVNVLKSIGHNQLVEKLNSVELELGSEFVCDGRNWMVEAIDGSIITASNSDDDVIRIEKKYDY